MHAVAQVLTSANYGGVVANFMTGGLSLQVEHHLFPAISFLHYPAISRVVASECAARGIPYSRYASLPEAIAAFCRFGSSVLGLGTHRLVRAGNTAQARLQRADTVSNRCPFVDVQLRRFTVRGKRASTGL